MSTLTFALALLTTWLLACIAVVSFIVVLDFLVIGRHGRLDWIANLFRKEKDEE